MVVGARPQDVVAGMGRRSRHMRPVASMVALSLVVAGMGAATTAVAIAAAPGSTAATTAAYAPVPAAVPVPSAPSLAVVAPVTTGLDAFGSAVLDAINAQRSAAGVAPLVEAKGMDAQSSSWSTKMAAAGSLSHNPQGWEDTLNSGASGRTDFGENVSSWTGSPVSGYTLTNGLMGSPTNRRNVLDPNFKYVGIGTATGTSGSQWNTITFVDAVDAGQIYDPALRSIPIGQLNSATLIGSTVRVTGWGYDADIGTSPIQMRVTDTAPDGSVNTTTVTADAVRTDVPQLTAATGDAHGLAVTLPIAGRGPHLICARLINAGAGTVDPDLGCLPVGVGGPVGNLDAAVLNGSTVSLAGWALDPDAPTTPTTVTITDQSPTGTVTLPTVTAGQIDANVDSAIPGVGAAHGFLAQATVSTVGIHVLCAQVSSLSTPTLTKALGCLRMVVAGPAGAITGTTNTTNSVTVNGWALDPNLTGSASTVRVQVSGPNGPVGATSVVTAGATGTGSLQKFPSAGSAHSFSVTVATTAFGSYQVCAIANSLIDPNASTSLGCQNLTISNLAGWLDSVAMVKSSIQVRAWSIDQGHPTSTVQLSVVVSGPSGTRTTQIAANAPRPDIGRAFPAAGSNHTITSLVAQSGRGVNTVCVGAVATTDQTTRQFRCLTVNVP